MTTLPSRIESVTVYRMGARITRVASLAPTNGAWPERVVLDGLPLALDERSVRVRVESESGEPPLATDLKVGLAVPAPDPTLPPADDEALRRAEREVRRAELRCQELAEARVRITELEVLPRPVPEEGQPPSSPPVAGRLGLLAFRDEQSRELLARFEEAAGALDDARKLRDDLLARRARESSAREAREEELRKTVEVQLSANGGGSAPARLLLEYQVPGARWAPAYTLRLDRSLREAHLSVRAAVQQRSGEDWSEVTLTLSTADAERWTELPELQSLRIGRRRAPPVRLGWRPPPDGALALFHDYDAAFPTPRPAAAPQGSARKQQRKGARRDEPVPQSMAAGFGAPADMMAGGAPPPEELEQSMALDDDFDEDFDDDEAFLAEEGIAAMDIAGEAPPAPPPPAAPARASMMLQAKAASAPRRKRRAAPRGGGGPGAPPPAPPEPSALEADDALLEFASLRMPPPGSGRRGRLTPVEPGAVYLEVQAEHHLSFDVRVVVQQAVTRAHAAATVPPPPGHVWPSSAEGYDYAYPADERVSVPADDAFHVVPLTEASGESTPRFVCVPMQSQDVFREVELHNPLDAPLLDGPLDVYLGEEFLLTSRARGTPARGELRVGLGVEQRIKAARNVRFEEETSGLIRGTLGLGHHIEVELRNLLETPAQVEVRERVPVKVENDDDVEIVERSVDPPWESYEPEDPPMEGGRRWRVEVGAGEKRTLTARWEVRIPSKHELVGGNRRA